MRRSLRSAALLVALLCGAPALGQTRDDGQLWLMWFGQGRLGGSAERPSPWRWWLDVHERFRKDAEDLDTVFLRPAVGRSLFRDVVLWFGYAYFHNEPDGRSPFREQRLWQQLTFTVPNPVARLAGRTRLEQRFFEGDGETGWRLRQFFKTTVPLGADRGPFVSLWDELFYDLHDTDFGQRRGLRQNRAFVGLGWHLGGARRTTLEVGYLNQWIDRPNVDGLNHVLSVNVFMAW